MRQKTWLTTLRRKHYQQNCLLFPNSGAHCARVHFHESLPSVLNHSDIHPARMGRHTQISHMLLVVLMPLTGGNGGWGLESLWTWIPALPLARNTTLDKLLKLCVSISLSVNWESNGIYVRAAARVSELMLAKHLTWWDPDSRSLSYNSGFANI